MNNYPYRVNGVFVPSLYQRYRRQRPDWELPNLFTARVTLKDDLYSYGGGGDRKARVISADDSAFEVVLLDENGEEEGLLDEDTGDWFPTAVEGWRWADEGKTWDFDEN